MGAFVGVKLSVRGNDRATTQREIAARREEWWRRFTWAADLTLDEVEARRAAGLRVLTQLALTELSQRDEHLILDAFPARVLGQTERDMPPGTVEEKVAAAQLRLVLDRVLGNITPDYVRHLAGESRDLRSAARRHRRIHSAIQLSALASSMFGLILICTQAGSSPLLWCAVAFGAFVTVAISVSMYFKFKEREINLLQTAESIEANSLD